MASSAQSCSEHGQIRRRQRLVERLREVAGELDGLVAALQRRLRVAQAPQRMRLPGPRVHHVVDAMGLLQAPHLVGVVAGDNRREALVGLLQVPQVHAGTVEHHARKERRRRAVRALIQRVKLVGHVLDPFEPGSAPHRPIAAR